MLVRLLTWLTIVTLALRRSRFSSCSALHLSLNVSSSILRTLFSCCNEANRFVSSSKRNCEITMLGFPEFEAGVDIGVAELLPAPSVSLSLALSAMAVTESGRQRQPRRWSSADNRNQTLGDLANACRHSAATRKPPVPTSASVMRPSANAGNIISMRWRFLVCLTWKCAQKYLCFVLCLTMVWWTKHWGAA